MMKNGDMEKDPLDGREFILYGNELIRLLSWLSPYIEKAGYNWTTKTTNDSFGKVRVTITKYERRN